VGGLGFSRTLENLFRRTGKFGLAGADTLELQAIGSEIEQKTGHATGGPKVMRELSHFGKAHCRQCLQFDEDVVMAAEVRAVGPAQSLPSVPDGDGDFAFVGDAPRGKLQLEGMLVAHFEEAWS
jgi:hypothetical protein